MGFRFLIRGAALSLLTLIIAIPPISAVPRKCAAPQSTEAKPQAAAISSYPESAEGLKHLLLDWFAAIEAGDTAKSSQYLESFAIPNHQEWFVKTFGAVEGARLEAKYTESQAKSPDALEVRAERAVRADKLAVETWLFDKSACGQPPELHALSAAMVHPTPIYRALSHKEASDGSPDFLGNFVYVHGGFRYFEQRLMKAPSTTPPMRVSLAQNVLSESFCGVRTAPLYPPLARQTKVQGTVVLHAIIGTDGTVKELQVVSGHPLLIQAAIDDVKRWRYKPTLLNGKPVEVDTEIDVVFSLQQ